jgi:hypothetical protein
VERDPLRRVLFRDATVAVTESAPATLDYAQQPSRLRRWRRRLGRAVVIALLLAGGVAAYRYRHELELRASEIYWSRRCMGFDAPRDSILFVGDPAAAAALRERDPDYVQTRLYGRAGAKFLPRCWRELCAAMNNPAVVAADTVMDDPVLFLHERRSPGGKRRIVMIKSGSYNARALPRKMRATIITPARLFARTQVMAAPMPDVAWSGVYVPLRIFFGHPDPADASHFTIDFVVLDGFDGAPIRNGTIDGYLNDDDTVSFRLRDPATTRGFD